VGIVGSDHAGGYVSQHVALLRPRGVDSRWLAYSIFCSRAQDQLLGGQYGGTKQLLGLDELAELSIRVPARRDQERLVRTLDHAKRIRDRTKAALQRQLSLLSEHRQALITAAVTGELEIPEAAA
jgi:type I restriction enzyme S subunit